MIDDNPIRTTNFHSRTLYGPREIRFNQLPLDESGVQVLGGDTMVIFDDRKRLKFIRYADQSSVIRHPKYILASNTVGEYWCGWKGMWSRLD